MKKLGIPSECGGESPSKCKAYVHENVGVPSKCKACVHKNVGVPSKCTACVNELFTNTVDGDLETFEEVMISHRCIALEGSN